MGRPLYCTSHINSTNNVIFFEATRLFRQLSQCSISILPEKHEKTFGFLTFSGGIEMVDLVKMG